MPSLRASLAVLALATLSLGASGRDASEGAAALATLEGTVRVSVPQEAAPAMLSPYARRRYRPPTPTAYNCRFRPAASDPCNERTRVHGV